LSNAVHIALDAMGGDHAPQSVLAGANMARQRYPELHFHIFGDEAVLKPRVDRLRGLAQVTTLHHTDEVVAADSKPSQVVRSKAKTSMRQAIDLVKAGEAAGVVSAGNTGALMGLAMFMLGTMKGVDRPAIASYFPTVKGETVLLDLGANVTCDARNLFQFAVMGEMFARTVLGVQEPTIGLLNIGSEAVKGHETLKDAAALLRETTLPLHFHGFVEGDDIPAGTVDVVVTDGFTGNVAVKIAEGTASLVTGFIRGAFQSSLSAMIGYVFAKRALQKIRVRTDPRRYNGAVLAGLNGIVVKSHGGADALGFATAVGVSYDLVRYGFMDKIAAELAELTQQAAAAEADRAAAAS